MAVESLLLLKSGKPRGFGLPSLLRVGKARNDCTHTHCDTGVPPTTACADPRENHGVDVSTPYCALVSLKRRRIALGVIMGSQRDGDTKGRTAGAMASQACEIKEDDSSELYDFLFIDQAHFLNGRESKVVKHITAGEVLNGSGDWVQCKNSDGRSTRWAVITNDNGVSASNLDTVAYAHTHALRVVGSQSNKGDAKKAADGAIPPLSSEDYDFVRAVNSLSNPTTAILRLEVVQGTANFGTWLGRARQCSLLRKWGRLQQVGDVGERFTLIYPYYVHGGRDRKEVLSTYDSTSRKTARSIFELIGKFQGDRTYNDPLTGCG